MRKTSQTKVVNIGNLYSSIDQMTARSGHIRSHLVTSHNGSHTDSFQVTHDPLIAIKAMT